MSKSADKKFIKIYHGYGHTHDLLLYGHLFEGKPVTRKKYSTNGFANFFYLLKLFFVRPAGNTVVELYWQNQVLQNKTASDGFIKFEWESMQKAVAGWHAVQIRHKENNHTITGEGKLFVPHITQYGFISDIDDTIMVSHSATIFKRLKELFTANPHTRKIFDDVALHYRLLALSHTNDEEPNPFFYVSSSEWNLYDYLQDFFTYNKLPQGALLLNQVKRWYELLRTGKTKHSGKLLRVIRILDTFPSQQFVLLGDNTQQDPLIYKQIAEKYPGRIFAVYIRNVYTPNETGTRQLLETLTQKTGTHTCFFNNSNEAIQHSKRIGLIS